LNNFKNLNNHFEEEIIIYKNVYKNKLLVYLNKNYDTLSINKKKIKIRTSKMVIFKAVKIIQKILAKL
jgi:hypothetical protein